MKCLPRTTSLLTIALALAGVALTASPARAATLAENTGITSGTNVVGAFQGQSFTVTGSGSFTNITFNFFLTYSPTTPYAVGTAFLLSSEYLGTPGYLSSGTPGYLGSAAASGGFYNFNSGVTLVAGMKYFLYSNGATDDDTGANNSYGGGAYYAALLPNLPNFYRSDTVDHRFRVTGDAVTANAPDGGSTALLLALGLAALWAGRRPHRA